MGTKFYIIVPYLENFEPSSGTTIRIAGYTSALNDLNIDYRFLSSVKPGYVPGEKHELLNMNRRWTKILLVHNILLSSNWLWPLSYMFRYIIRYFAKIDHLSEEIGDRIIWSHQDNTVAMYLYFVYGIKFIYDVHGFFDIQREYRSGLSFWRKIWFDLYLRHEKIVLNKAPYINVVSKPMSNYVETNFSPEGKILLAPDAIPSPLDQYLLTPENGFRGRNNINENDKIILFTGSFKKIGGATELVKVFIKNENLNTKAVLVLIGNGQEEELIYNLIDSSKCNGRIFHIDSMPHEELISLMKEANVIVCPDITGNLYNEMTPHIKLFDAIASGKNVVASDFLVNRELFDPQEFNIFYFTYENENSFSETLHLALQSKARKYNKSILENFTYLEQTKKYLSYFN